MIRMGHPRFLDPGGSIVFKQASAWHFSVLPAAVFLVKLGHQVLAAEAGLGSLE